jgi:hypothetical protein
VVLRFAIRRKIEQIAFQDDPHPFPLHDPGAGKERIISGQER